MQRQDPPNQGHPQQVSSLQFQDSQKPSYRINYRQCQIKGHEAEKLNLICLNKKCQENSLICSMCIEQQHKKHKYQPLKHFLQKLSSVYSKSNNKNQHQQQTELNNELEQLEVQKYQLMNKLKIAVHQIAQHFEHLEASILEKYQKIKSNIFERVRTFLLMTYGLQESKKQKFSSFYQQMTSLGKGDPNFQIQNYLIFEPLETFSMNNQIQQVQKSACSMLNEVIRDITKTQKDHLLLNELIDGEKNETLAESQQINKDDSKDGDWVLPANITRSGSVFKNTNEHSTLTVGYMSGVSLKDMTGNKMRIKIVSKSANKMPFFVIGVARRSDLQNQNPKHSTLQGSNKSNFHWLDNMGKSHVVNYNYINSLTPGQTIELLVKKNHLKITHKNNICDIILGDKENSVLFFELRGNGSAIEVTYPFQK